MRRPLITLGVLGLLGLGAWIALPAGRSAFGEMIAWARTALVRSAVDEASASGPAAGGDAALANADNAGDGRGGQRFSRAEPSPDRRSRLARLPVRAVVAERADFVLGVHASGRTEPRRRVELAPAVSEVITRVHVREGDRVRRGAALIELAQPRFQMSYREAEVELSNAQADYHVRLLADSTLSAAKRELVAHQIGVTQAQLALDRARLDLDATTLRAPFAGFVSAVDAEIGGFAPAGTPRVTLADLSSIRIPAEVLETDFARLESGARATVSFPALPGESFAGVVAALSPELDPERGTGIAYIELDNQEARIKPGMYAEVSIASAVVGDRIAVPRSAVLERDRKLIVFRAAGGRAEWTYVETGLENDELIELVSGVAPGDTVLVEGQMTLAHGAPVRVQWDED